MPLRMISRQDQPEYWASRQQAGERQSPVQVFFIAAVAYAG